MQQKEQTYRLFDSRSEKWPLNNHRAEFARKLIVYSVGATVREYAGRAISQNFHHNSNEVIAHLLFDVFTLENSLISLLTQAYNELRKASPDDTDPELSQMHEYVKASCEQKLHNSHNLLLTHLEGNNQSAANFAETERDETAMMLEFLDAIFLKMRLYSDLGTLMQLTNFSPLLRSALANQIALHTLLIS